MSRWKIDKYGFVNFWLFDKEEIKTAEGNLLLNGENGSGKSVTLQSFIPLIFDGDLSSRNLSTEGDSSRKMDYYLSYGGKKEGISYLYGELSRIDSQGKKRYVNLIVGMRARNGSLVSKWFVITRDKRIGEDFSLYKSDGSTIIPYDKQSLKKVLKTKIEGSYELYEKPQEYKVAVNNEVFGFGEVDEYDETLNLIRKLRKPDLKENGSLDPKKIYEILNDSLKVMPENELRGMTDTLENIEKISTELKTMKSRLGVLKGVRDDYDTYKKIVLVKRIREYFKAYDGYEQGKERYEKDIEKKGIKEKRYEKAIEKSERYTTEAEAKRKELDELEGSEGNSLINLLHNCREEIIKLEKNIARLDKDIETEGRRAEGLKEKLRSIKIEYDKSRTKCLDRIENLKKLQGEMGLEWDVDYYDIVEDGRIAQVDILSKKYIEHRKNIEKLMKLIGSLNLVEKEIIDIDKRLVEERKRVECYQNEMKISEAVNTEKVLEFLEIFNEDYLELEIDYKSVREFQELTIDLSEDYNGREDVLELFKKLKDYKNEELSKESMSYEREIEKIQENIDEKTQEKTILEGAKDSEIELLTHQKKARKDKKGLLPFYKCVRFKDGIDEGTKGRIERSLWEIGVLDALVGDETLLDRYVDETTSVEKNLTSYLEVEDGCIEDKKVLGVLKSIATDKNGELYVTEKGEYRNRIITGRVDECRGIYIGIEARKKQREEEIRRLEKEIGRYVEEKGLLEESREEVQESIATLKKEYEGLVERYKEVFDPIYEEYKELGILIKNKKTEVYNLEKNLGKKTEKKQEIYKELEIKEKRLNISIKREKYLELDGILRDFKQELEVFKTLLENKISYGVRIEDIKINLGNVEDIQDRYRQERRVSINVKKGLDENKKSYEKEIKSKNLDNLGERITSLRNIINKEIPNKRHLNDVAMGKLESEIEGLKLKIGIEKNKVEELNLAREVEEKLLKLEINQDHNISEGEIIDITGKKSLYERYREYENKKEQHYINRINT